MAKATGATKRKVPIHNPFPKGGGKTAVLSGAKRSITDLNKQWPIRNPIKGGVSNSAVRALSEQSYKAGLLAGKAKGGKPNKNPIGLNEAMDLAKVGLLGTVTTIGVDIAAGQVLPRLNISKTANANVYYLAKIIGAVVAGEVLSDATKGASYTGAGGAITVYMTEFAREMLKGKLPANVPLGALPQMRVVAPPALPPMQPMQPMTFAGAARSKTIRPRGMSL